LGKILPRREPTDSRSKQRVRVSQSGVSERVVRVFVDRLLEVLDAFVQTLRRPPIPVVAAQEIESVSLGVLGVMLGQALLLLA
jgi:hypothetical protein